MYKENDDKKRSSDDSEKQEEILEVSLDIEDEKSDTGPTPEDKLANLQDQHLRLQAEFDNYRKRMNARSAEISRFAGEGIILKILEVADNLERALEVDFKIDPESAKSGISGIYKQLEKILNNESVHPIECVGKDFDPYYQNAIQTVTDETLPDGVVVQEFQKGYMIREKVLRPAVVSVNRLLLPEEPQTETTGTEEFTNDTNSDDKKGEN